jgi:hypothetical protein
VGRTGQRRTLGVGPVRDKIKKKNEVGISFRAQLALVAKENGKAFLNYKHDFEFKPRVCKHFQIKILN